MRPAMASIPQKGVVQKASVIYKAAFYYIFLSFLIGKDNKALLKYYRGNL